MPTGKAAHRRVQSAAKRGLYYSCLSLLHCATAPHSQNHRQHQHNMAAVRKLDGSILDPAQARPAPIMPTGKAAHRRVQSAAKLGLYCL